MPAVVRWLTMAVMLGLLAGACAGSDAPAELATDTATQDEAAASRDDDGSVPVVLAFLGDLAVPAQPAVVSAFEPAGGSIAMGEGSSLSVAAGAFAAPTEVSMQRVALDFEPFFDAPRWGQAYVVSTVEDLDPAAPVTIDIDRPANELRAVQLLDGEWSPAPVVDVNGTAQIAIPHFSEVITMVVEAFTQEQAAAAPPAEAGRVDAEFLGSCIVSLGVLSGGIGPGGRVEDGFASNLVYSICVSALIRRSTPPDRSVSTECVGDRIGGDVDFAGAIAECLASETDADTDGSPQDTDTGSDTAPVSPPPPPPADSEATQPASYSVTLSDADIPGSPSDSTHVTSFTADADVGPDGAEIAVSYSIFVWLRGGETAPPHEDQNCGATYSATAFGQGAVGAPTTIGLEITSFEITDTIGALCRDGDAEFHLRSPGDTAGSFTGRLNGLGFDGEQRLTGFFTTVEFAVS